MLCPAKCITASRYRGLQGEYQWTTTMNNDHPVYELKDGTKSLAVVDDTGNWAVCYNHNYTCVWIATGTVTETPDSAEWDQDDVTIVQCNATSNFIDTLDNAYIAIRTTSTSTSSTTTITTSTKTTTKTKTQEGEGSSKYKRVY